MIVVSIVNAGQFKTDQLNQSRVKASYRAVGADVEAAFKIRGAAWPPQQFYIRAFKHEQLLELWSKAASDDTLLLVDTFPFTSYSGVLGPKRKQGDGQIPEGLYHISHFNPWSNFYLSLKVSYPNKADRITSPYPNKGGDVFIHGEDVTIGCMPLGDRIRELYVAAVEARDNGQQKIPVHIFPYRFGAQPALPLAVRYEDVDTLWVDLETVYRAFEAKKKVPVITVDNKGRYLVQE